VLVEVAVLSLHLLTLRALEYQLLKNLFDDAMEVDNFVRGATVAAIPLALLNDLVLIAVMTVDCLAFWAFFRLVDHEVANPAEEMGDSVGQLCGNKLVG
jgi:hypothetical protein